MASHAVGSDGRKHNAAFDLIDEHFENLSSISIIFQKPHDFLILTGSVNIYISLTLKCLVVTKADTFLNKHAAKSCRLFKYV